MPQFDKTWHMISPLPHCMHTVRIAGAACFQQFSVRHDMTRALWRPDCELLLFNVLFVLLVSLISFFFSFAIIAWNSAPQPRIFCECEKLVASFFCSWTYVLFRYFLFVFVQKSLSSRIEEAHNENLALRDTNRNLLIQIHQTPESLGMYSVSCGSFEMMEYAKSTQHLFLRNSADFEAP